MTRILSYANQKGGVGKTSISVHHALALAEVGDSVLYVDLDPQGNGTRYLSSRALSDSPENGEGYTRSVSLFKESGMVFAPYPARENIDLIWTRKNDRELNDMGEVPTESCIHPSNNLHEIAGRYDWVLIDTPPTLNKLQLSALIASTHVVCPVKLSGFGLDGIEGLIETIRDVQEHINHELEFIGIILNQAATRSTNYRKDVEELKGKVGDLVFHNSISMRRPIDEACSISKPVWKIYTGAARPAAKEMISVFKEINERIENSGGES